MTNEIGIPWKLLGIFLVSNFSRIALKATITNAKPKAEPIALEVESKNVESAVIFEFATPKIAQLVVIKGKYTPDRKSVV